jgi:AP-1 complex subunit mu
VHYTPETSSIVWKIKQFGGAKEFLMRAELGLPSVRGDDDKGGGMMGGFGGSMGGVGGGKAKRPIQVKFEIPYFTTSGIQVRYLKIIEPKVRCNFPCPRPCAPVAPIPRDEVHDDAFRAPILRVPS